MGDQNLADGPEEEGGPTVGKGDLEGLGSVPQAPRGQAAVGVAAHELLAFVVPADRVDGLRRRWGG